MKFARFTFARDVEYDIFINKDNIVFICAYYDDDNNYIIAAQLKFQQSDGTFSFENYIVLNETMESIAKKLGLEGE